MIRYEDECVSCGLPCLGSGCPNRHVRRLYCDNCKDETDKLYQYDGEELCLDCLLDNFTVIE